MTRSIWLPRGFILALLSSIYILGFLVTPYWLLHKSPAEILFYLALTICIGLIWLFLSAGSIRLEFGWKDAGLFLFLLVGAIVLNYRALNSVIPFRGDEALHIGRTLDVVDRLPVLPTLILLILFIIFMLAGFKKQKWAIPVGIFIVISVVFYFLGKNLFTDMEEYPQFFLRYPFINYWFFAVAPKLASTINTPYHEVLYRIIPFLSMVGTAWIIQRKSGTSSLLNGIGWGLAVVTVPLVFYYSSILYLEPPAVLLMTIACLDIDNLLHNNTKEISQRPSWYALLLIGFIKETAIPFLACFVAIRIAVQLQIWSKKTSQERSERPLLNLLAGELGIAFILLAPLLLYLYFRATLTDTRSFTPQISNLFDLANYRFVLLAFMQQFGPFFFFFIAGCILLIRNREFTTLFCYLAFIFAVLAFHTLDYKVYAGYSRFDLFILPPILAGSTRLIAWAAKQKPDIGSILILAALVSNLLLSPVNLDGVKVPYWGTRIDDSEHYYPYQDALIWLKNNQPQKRILFTGSDFYYPLDFYWNKLDWKPRKERIPSEGISDETLAISNVLKTAESEHYGVVVYRVLGTEDPVLPQSMNGFRVQIIKNSAHTLLIFYEP